MRFVLLMVLLPALHCHQQNLSKQQSSDEPQNERQLTPKNFPAGSWQNFLQHLPFEKKAVVDYNGNKVQDQYKQFAVLPFDVGKRDLQQCADALMRLRAEYLWEQNQIDEIAFHFTDGRLYRFSDYCKGLRPQPHAGQIKMVERSRCEPIKSSLRNYLDIVYTYAGTISLEHELKNAKGLGVGTVIIKGGSPGHCMMIIDEAVDDKGISYYRLVESYTPAQSIYVLQNPTNHQPDPWFRLDKGKTIETHSYRLSSIF